MPYYSPELNPDEYFNCYLKACVRSGMPARSKVNLKGNVLSHMRMFQKRPAWSTSYFRHSSIKYAA
ncbi:hypothetical protein I6N98_09120 [Spongiibacter nanhainus]|uniref:DDE superfamily endonuclease n=1 Tax=Spongiibacter nanhainus TaxID=2794344 RepID=A0A7T4URQ6_9GAMM|nr:hypothetical protein I6N98_09120 [Spongiibacter nanhainus]